MKNRIAVAALIAGLLFATNVGWAQESYSGFQGNFRVSHVGAYWQPHLSSDLSLGYRFNPYFYAGLASGVHLLHEDNGWPLALPLYLDVVGYLPFNNRKCFVYLGAEAGGMQVFSQTMRVNPKWLLNAKTGLDIALNNKLGITLGVILMTTGRIDYSGLALTTGLRF